jgi:hypothetical protein
MNRTRLDYAQDVIVGTSCRGEHRLNDAGDAPAPRNPEPLGVAPESAAILLKSRLLVEGAVLASKEGPEGEEG